MFKNTVDQLISTSQNCTSDWRELFHCCFVLFCFLIQSFLSKIVFIYFAKFFEKFFLTNCGTKQVFSETQVAVFPCRSYKSQLLHPFFLIICLSLFAFLFSKSCQLKQICRFLRIAQLFNNCSSFQFFKWAPHEVKRDYNSDFFQSTRTDQNSSTKFYGILWCHMVRMVFLSNKISSVVYFSSPTLMCFR